METVSAAGVFEIVCCSGSAFSEPERLADYQPFDMQGIDKDFLDEVFGAQVGDCLVESCDDDFIEMASG